MKRIILLLIISLLLAGCKKTVDLPIYNIEIPKKSLKELAEDTPKVNYVLENPFRYQPATINGESVELKYRGVYDSHWGKEKKNMTIKFDNKRKLLLIIPEAMSMIPNSLNSYSAEVLGLPSPITKFVQVYVNDEYHGVYEDSENVDKYFLENHNLPYGDIYDIELNQDSFLLNKWANEDYDIYWNQLSGSDTDNLRELLHIYNLESDEEFKERIEDILDIDEYLRWAAHNYFPGTTRQSDHNIKLYYHPELKKFWQIPWDLEGYSYNGHIDLSINATSNGLMNRILSFNDYNQRKNQLIWEHLNGELSAENQIKKVEEFYEEIKEGMYQDPYKRATRKGIPFNNKDFDNSIKELKDWIRDRDKNLRLQLSQANIAAKVERGTGKVRISTAWGVGAYVDQIIINGKVFPIETYFFPDKSEYDPVQPVYKLEMFKDPIVSKDYTFNDIVTDIEVISYNAVTKESLEASINFVDKFYPIKDKGLDINFRAFLDNEGVQ